MNNNKDKLDNALLWAIIDCDFDVIDGLIKNGLDIQVNNNEALSCAYENGGLEVVKYLVSKGADINASPINTLRCLCNYNNIEVIKYLISKGFTVKTKEIQNLIANEIKQKLLFTTGNFFDDKDKPLVIYLKQLLEDKSKFVGYFRGN